MDQRGQQTFPLYFLSKEEDKQSLLSQRYNPISICLPVPSLTPITYRMDLLNKRPKVIEELEIGIPMHNLIFDRLQISVSVSPTILSLSSSHFNFKQFLVLFLTFEISFVVFGLYSFQELAGV